MSAPFCNESFCHNNRILDRSAFRNLGAAEDDGILNFSVKFHIRCRLSCCLLLRPGRNFAGATIRRSCVDLSLAHEQFIIYIFLDHVHICIVVCFHGCDTSYISFEFIPLNMETVEVRNKYIEEEMFLVMRSCFLDKVKAADLSS